MVEVHEGNLNAKVMPSLEERAIYIYLLDIYVLE